MVPDELNFGGLIINKLYFVFSFPFDTIYVNILGPTFLLRARHAPSISGSELGCRGEEESIEKSKEV
jgi:hypothetical protein